MVQVQLQPLQSPFCRCWGPLVLTTSACMTPTAAHLHSHTILHQSLPSRLKFYRKLQLNTKDTRDRGPTHWAVSDTRTHSIVTAPYSTYRYSHCTIFFGWHDDKPNVLETIATYSKSDRSVSFTKNEENVRVSNSYAVVTIAYILPITNYEILT